MRTYRRSPRGSPRPRIAQPTPPPCWPPHGEHLSTCASAPCSPCRCAPETPDSRRPHRSRACSDVEALAGEHCRCALEPTEVEGLLRRLQEVRVANRDLRHAAKSPLRRCRARRIKLDADDRRHRPVPLRTDAKHACDEFPSPQPGSSTRADALGGPSAKSFPTMRSTTWSGVVTKPFTGHSRRVAGR